MKRLTGKIIVIDGTDGSGKTIQVALLLKHLNKDGYKTALADFPQYGLPSAYFVERYLRGEYGGANEVNPYLGSLFYALDRFEAKEKINNALTRGKILISNRYVSASMGHQGAKIKSRFQRRKFFKWVENIEHDIVGMPRPSLTIILHVPARLAQKLVDKKGRRAYIRRKRDIHEDDIKHLAAAEKTYLEMAKYFGYKVVECVENGKLLTPKEIHERVWSIVVKNF